MCIQTGESCKWTSDGKWFILDNFDSIGGSPTTRYNFIPVLCPPSSWLYNNYTTELPKKIKIVTGSADWGTCVWTVSCGNGITAFECWRKTIAIGLQPNNIAIFDALTGSQTGVLSGHTKTVNSLAFSHCGK